MRDPERIPKVLEALERRWRLEPDLRLGQLISNTAADLRESPFQIEDGVWLKAFAGDADRLEPEPPAAGEPGPLSRPSGLAD